MVTRARVGIKGKKILQRISNLRSVNQDLVNQALKATGATVKRAVENSELTREAPPVKRPIQWKSEKQRRAFFATNGFGGGIPYGPRKGIWKQWEIKVIARRDESILTIENLSPAARYVYGPNQQPFHRNTGWPLLKRNKRDRSGFKKFDKLGTEEFEKNYLEALEDMIFRGRS